MQVLGKACVWCRITWETWLPRGLPEGLGAKPILSCYTSYHKWLQVFTLACLSFQEHLENGGRYKLPRFGEQNEFPMSFVSL